MPSDPSNPVDPSDPSDPSDPDAGLRGVVTGALVAAFATWLVYATFWDGAVPVLPVTPALLAAVGVGGLLGAAVEYNDARDGLDPSAETFLGLVVLGILLSVLVFTEGLPVSAEVGLLALVWTGFATRVAFAFGPFRPGGRDTG